MSTNINLTSPSGVTLLTKGKYCADDYSVIPATNEAAVYENGTYAALEGYVGVTKIEVGVPVPEKLTDLTDDLKVMSIEDINALLEEEDAE